jgi:predicted RNase H-like HicB family nuclease
MDALIVRHLSDIDTAAKRLSYSLEAQVGKAIDGIVEAWAEKNGWNGTFEWDQNELSVVPPEWKYRENGADEDSRSAWFYLYAGQGDDFDSTNDLDYFWLTRLCGSGRGELGFWWEYEKGSIAPKGRKWKQFVRPYIERARETGFTYDEESGLFFIPVRVEPEFLAQAIENESIEDALQPIEMALEACIAAKPVFDEILDAARAQFKGGA